jgi:hypothetical protein
MAKNSDTAPLFASSPDGIVAIGFRAESAEFNWGVVTRRDGKLTLIAADTQAIPKGYEEAHGLVWCRKRLYQIIEQYAPVIGGIRYPEAIAKKKHVTGSNARLRIEGVILEALASKGVTVITGTLKEIGSEMGSDSPKAYLGRSEVRGMDWSGHTLYRREAIIVAVAALEHAQQRKVRHGNQE